MTDFPSKFFFLLKLGQRMRELILIFQIFVKTLTLNAYKKYLTMYFHYFIDFLVVIL